MLQSGASAVNRCGRSSDEPASPRPGRGRLPAPAPPGERHRAPPRAPASSAPGRHAESAWRKPRAAAPERAQTSPARRAARPTPAHKAHPPAPGRPQWPASDAPMSNNNAPRLGNQRRVGFAIEQRRPARFQPGKLAAADSARQQLGSDGFEPRLLRRRAAVQLLEPFAPPGELDRTQRRLGRPRDDIPHRRIEHPQRPERRPDLRRRVDQRQFDVR